MKRSLLLRGGLALGVFLFVAGPLGATAASAAKKHHKPKPPPPPVSAAGPSVKALGDLQETSIVGAVGFALHGAGWYADEPIEVASPGLASGCLATELGGALSFTPGNPATGDTDFSGTFNVFAAGVGCAPGTYQVTAEEVDSPNRVATTNLVITAPAAPPSSPSLTLSPASEVETGISGTIAGTFVLQGLPPNLAFTAASPALAGACATGTFGGPLDGQAVDTAGPLSPGFVGETDFAGYDIGILDGAGCNAGSYPISVTENGAGHHEFDANFTVTAP